MSSDGSINGCKVLVTGGASGLGLSIAQALQQRGARVAIADVDGTTLERVAKQNELLPIDMNVTSADSVQSGVDAVAKEFGGLDCLVNSAGVIRFRLMRDLSESDWDRTLDINLKGVFLVCRAAAPYICKSGRGRIVSIASDAGKKGFPLISAYCASKFGLIGFSKAIAGELAPFQVTVNCVCPTGVTNTAMGQEVLDYLTTASGKDRSAILASRSAGVPLGRMATPDDVTQAVLFLLSEAASFITGEAINVDGGVLSTGTVPGADTGDSA